MKYSSNIKPISFLKSHASEMIEDTNKITFTVSMGLSSRNDLKDIDKILQKADELLYLAKGSGKNRLIRESTKI